MSAERMTPGEAEAAIAEMIESGAAPAGAKLGPCRITGSALCLCDVEGLAADVVVSQVFLDSDGAYAQAASVEAIDGAALLPLSALLGEATLTGLDGAELHGDVIWVERPAREGAATFSYTALENGEPRRVEVAVSVAPENPDEPIDLRAGSPFIDWRGPPDQIETQIAALRLVPRAAATHRAIASGAWSNPEIWGGEAPPGPGARVHIPLGVEVRYDVDAAPPLATLRIDGALSFSTDRNTALSAETVVVTRFGRFAIGSAIAPIAETATAQLRFAVSEDSAAADPLGLRLGLIVFGAFTLRGAAKQPHLKLSGRSGAGDVSIALSEEPQGWRPGDRILVTGTRTLDREMRDLQDEVRTAMAIEGRALRFAAPLTYAHSAPRPGLAATAANLTRNVIVASAATNAPEQRGYVLAFSGATLDLREALFLELGRRATALPRSPNAPPVAPSPGRVAPDRAALSFRGALDDADNRAQRIEGCVVHGASANAVAHLGGRAIVKHNVVYAAPGASFLAVTGDETGAWMGNLAVGGIGAPATAQASAREPHFERGVGFCLHGRGVRLESNVAASQSGPGFLFRSQEAEQLRDHARPIGGIGDRVEDSEPLIHGFRGNEAFAVKVGLEIWESERDRRQRARKLLQNFTAWSVQSGVELHVASHFLLRDALLISRPPMGRDIGPNNSAGSNGILAGRRIVDLLVKNVEAHGFHDAVRATGGAYEFNGAVQIDGLTAGDTITRLANLSENAKLLIEVDAPKHEASGRNGAAQKTNGAALSGASVASDAPIAAPGASLSGVDGFDAQDPTGASAPEGCFQLPDGSYAAIVQEIVVDRWSGEASSIEVVSPIADSSTIGDAPFYGELDVTQKGGRWVVRDSASTRSDVVAITPGATPVLFISDIGASERILRIKAQAGTVSALDKGWFRYAPPPDFHGQDLLTYVIEDVESGERDALGAVRLEIASGSAKPAAPSPLDGLAATLDDAVDAVRHSGVGDVLSHVAASTETPPSPGAEADVAKKADFAAAEAAAADAAQPAAPAPERSGKIEARHEFAATVDGYALLTDHDARFFGETLTADADVDYETTDRTTTPTEAAQTTDPAPSASGKTKAAAKTAAKTDDPEEASLKKAVVEDVAERLASRLAERLAERVVQRFAEDDDDATAAKPKAAGKGGSRAATDAPQRAEKPVDASEADIDAALLETSIALSLVDVATDEVLRRIRPGEVIDADALGGIELALEAAAIGPGAHAVKDIRLTHVDAASGAAARHDADGLAFAPGRHVVRAAAYADDAADGAPVFAEEIAFEIRSDAAARPTAPSPTPRGPSSTAERSRQSASPQAASPQDPSRPAAALRSRAPGSTGGVDPAPSETELSPRRARLQSGSSLALAILDAETLAPLTRIESGDGLSTEKLGRRNLALRAAVIGATAKDAKSLRLSIDGGDWLLQSPGASGAVGADQGFEGGFEPGEHMVRLRAFQNRLGVGVPIAERSVTFIAEDRLGLKASRPRLDPVELSFSLGLVDSAGDIVCSISSGERIAPEISRRTDLSLRAAALDGSGQRVQGLRVVHTAGAIGDADIARFVGDQGVLRIAPLAAGHHEIVVEAYAFPEATGRPLAVRRFEIDALRDADVAQPAETSFAPTAQNMFDLSAREETKPTRTTPAEPIMEAAVAELLAKAFELTLSPLSTSILRLSVRPRSDGRSTTSATSLAVGAAIERSVSVETVRLVLAHGEVVAPLTVQQLSQRSEASITGGAGEAAKDFLVVLPVELDLSRQHQLIFTRGAFAPIELSPSAASNATTGPAAIEMVSPSGAVANASAISASLADDMAAALKLAEELTLRAPDLATPTSTSEAVAFDVDDQDFALPTSEAADLFEPDMFGGSADEPDMFGGSADEPADVSGDSVLMTALDQALETLSARRAAINDDLAGAPGAESRSDAIRAPEAETLDVEKVEISDVAALDDVELDDITRRSATHHVTADEFDADAFMTGAFDPAAFENGPAKNGAFEHGAVEEEEQDVRPVGAAEIDSLNPVANETGPDETGLDTPAPHTVAAPARLRGVEAISKFAISALGSAFAPVLGQNKSSVGADDAAETLDAAAPVPHQDAPQDNAQDDDTGLEAHAPFAPQSAQEAEDWLTDDAAPLATDSPPPVEHETAEPELLAANGGGDVDDDARLAHLTTHRSHRFAVIEHVVRMYNAAPDFFEVDGPIAVDGAVATPALLEEALAAISQEFALEGADGEMIADADNARPPASGYYFARTAAALAEALFGYDPSRAAELAEDAKSAFDWAETERELRLSEDTRDPLGLIEEDDARQSAAIGLYKLTGADRFQQVYFEIGRRFQNPISHFIYATLDPDLRAVDAFEAEWAETQLADAAEIISHSIAMGEPATLDELEVVVCALDATKDLIFFDALLVGLGRDAASDQSKEFSTDFDWSHLYDIVTRAEPLQETAPVAFAWALLSSELTHSDQRDLHSSVVEMSASATEDEPELQTPQDQHSDAAMEEPTRVSVEVEFALEIETPSSTPSFPTLAGTAHVSEASLAALETMLRVDTPKAMGNATAPEPERISTADGPAPLEEEPSPEIAADVASLDMEHTPVSPELMLQANDWPNDMLVHDVLPSDVFARDVVASETSVTGFDVSMDDFESPTASADARIFVLNEAVESPLDRDEQLLTTISAASYDDAADGVETEGYEGDPHKTDGLETGWYEPRADEAEREPTPLQESAPLDQDMPSLDRPPSIEDDAEPHGSNGVEEASGHSLTLADAMRHHTAAPGEPPAETRRNGQVAPDAAAPGERPDDPITEERDDFFVEEAFEAVHLYSMAGHDAAVDGDAPLADDHDDHDDGRPHPDDQQYGDAAQYENARQFEGAGRFDDASQYEGGWRDAASNEQAVEAHREPLASADAHASRLESEEPAGPNHPAEDALAIAKGVAERILRPSPSAPLNLFGGEDAADANGAPPMDDLLASDAPSEAAFERAEAEAPDDLAMSRPHSLEKRAGLFDEEPALDPSERGLI